MRIVNECAQSSNWWAEASSSAYISDSRVHEISTRDHGDNDVSRQLKINELCSCTQVPDTWCLVYGVAYSISRFGDHDAQFVCACREAECLVPAQMVGHLGEFMCTQFPLDVRLDKKCLYGKYCVNEYLFVFDARIWYAYAPSESVVFAICIEVWGIICIWDGMDAEYTRKMDVLHWTVMAMRTTKVDSNKRPAANATEI